MAADFVRSEVQVIKSTSTAANSSSDAISGSFRLSWGLGGEETDYLPADIGEVALEAALEALEDVRDVQVKNCTFASCATLVSEALMISLFGTLTTRFVLH